MHNYIKQPAKYNCSNCVADKDIKLCEQLVTPECFNEYVWVAQPDYLYTARDGTTYAKRTSSGTCRGCVGLDNLPLCREIAGTDCKSKYIWIVPTAGVNATPDSKYTCQNSPARLTAVQAGELAQAAALKALDQLLEQVRAVAAEGCRHLCCANPLSESNIHELNALGFGVRDKISITW